MASAFASYYNQNDIDFPRFGISFLSEKRNACKEKADSGFHPETPATPHRSTKLAALNQLLGTFARKLASLKQYGLVRLAAQAVQPSQNIVAYRPWSGRYAPCFSPTSPRFIRHRRRFGDVARSSYLVFDHCGAAIGNLIIKINRITRFYFTIDRRTKFAPTVGKNKAL